jgi:chromosome partitioning protein
MKTVAVVNQKGGCGKTTTAIHLASAFASTGVPVLLVDLDPQGHAGLGLGVEAPEGRPALADVLGSSALEGGPGLAEILCRARPDLALAPASLSLARLETFLADQLGREDRLAEHLGSIPERWDLVFVDCPPNLGLLTINALVAAQEVLVPVETSPFCLQGLKRLEQTTLLVEEMTGRGRPLTLLPTLVDRRSRTTREILTELMRDYADTLLDARVYRASAFRAAAGEGRTVFESAPRSSAARDYRVAAELLAQRWRIDLEKGDRRFSGLRLVAGGAAFSDPVRSPQEVRLAGSWNDWEPDRGVELRELGDGLWVKLVPLPPGVYEYRFILGSSWVSDPTNPETRSNPMGEPNSVLRVPGRPRAEMKVSHLPGARPSSLDPH